MRPDTRAVVFDLDDTLYPYSRFRTSGFLAVARHLETATGLDARLIFTSLLNASRGPARGRELQSCLAQHDLPATMLSDLIDLLRHHEPNLRLPSTSVRALRRLRDGGWRIGVLTNGQPSIQARKVAALEIAPLVDVVVFATTCGAGAGKPDPEPFAEIARRLSCFAPRTVVVGDDERCDVQGARRAGMHAVHCLAWNKRPSTARYIVHRLTQVPVLASALLEETTSHHAA